MTAHTASAPLSPGCAVFLEPRSGWPTRAFAKNADCDQVVVMHLDPDDDGPSLVARMAAHASEFARSGTRLRTLIVACSNTDDKANERRAMLVRSLAPLLSDEDGRIVLSTEPHSELTLLDLIRSVAPVMGELGGRSITFSVPDDDIEETLGNREEPSGVFASHSEWNRETSQSQLARVS
jgi:hypothetical protein